MDEITKSPPTSPLVKELVSAFHSLLNALEHSTLKESTSTPIATENGFLSLTGLLAYQIGWGKLLIRWYRNGVEGKNVVMPGEGFTTWDYKGLRKHFEAIYSFNYDVQVGLLQNIVAEVIEIAEFEHLSGNLDHLGVWQWCTLKSGKQWPLCKWIRVNTIAPHKNAAALIRKHSSAKE